MPIPVYYLDTSSNGQYQQKRSNSTRKAMRMNEKTPAQETRSFSAEQQRQQELAENIGAAMGSAAPKNEELAIKDRIDDAIPKGPKKADQSSGGRVMIGERGDLHELAARKQSA